MSINVGINGFGRIGRGILRAVLKTKNLNIVAINDLVPNSQNAHLLKHDSVHGTISNDVTCTDNSLTIDGKAIKVFAEKDPLKIEWGKLGVDVVLECSGKFTEREQAELHLKAGAKKVIISSPAKKEDITIVMGVNHESYDAAKHNIISNASCTTNCLAPVAKILHDNFQIKRGFMTTIHSYTNDQRILDVGHKDLRRARAAAMSQIPTTTGAAKAIGLVIPSLKGKLDGISVRVPTPNVSCVDLVCELGKATTKEEVNAALKQASQGALKGILAYTEEPLVSCDFNGTTVSTTVDGLCTAVMEGTLLKILAWYDNETGFSYRMVDLTNYVASKM